MFRNYFLLIMCVLYCSLALGQVHLGGKAGANMTRIGGSAFNDGYELGYQLGGFVYLDVSESIGIQGELLFNQSNTKLSGQYSDIIDNAFDKAKTLNYISIPVLLRLNNEGFITFVAGPQFSFLAEKEKSVLENGRKAFKNTDFSFVAGAEVNLHPIIIYGRYAWGFSDISDFGGRSTSQQIQLGVGIRLF